MIGLPGDVESSRCKGKFPKTPHSCNAGDRQITPSAQTAYCSPNANTVFLACLWQHTRIFYRFEDGMQIGLGEVYGVNEFIWVRTESYTREINHLVNKNSEHLDRISTSFSRNFVRVASVNVRFARNYWNIVFGTIYVYSLRETSDWEWRKLANCVNFMLLVYLYAC
jgi:hypothetical protein